MAERYAIGVDVGGTKTAAGLVALPVGRVLARRLQSTDAHCGGRAVLEAVVAQLEALLDEASQLRVQPSSIGVGVAELVGRDGRVLSSATIDWKDIDVAAEVQARTGLPATVEADVRAAARGEAELGAGRGLTSFLYVTVGTGISGCLVVGGVPYTGARGLTGTFGSGRGLIPSDDGRLAAGPPLEGFAAGPALAARYATAGADGGCAAPEVIARADAGDAAARSIVASAGEALGAALAQLVNMLDPAAIVIGGGLGMVGGIYRASIDAALREYVWSEMHRDVPLLSAQLGADAGFIGAAIAALDRHP